MSAPSAAAELATPLVADRAAPSSREARHAWMLGMLVLVFASWCVDALLLALLHLAGGVRLEAALLTLGGALLICVSFYLVFRLHWNERFKDAFLTVPLLAAAIGLQLLVAYRAPEVALLSVFVIFLIFTFGTLRLRRRQLVWAWLLTSIGIGVLAMSHRQSLAVPHATAAQALLSAAWLALTLGRCAFVGLYGASVRHQLGTKNAQLSEARNRLHELATHDGLTGALNRAAVLEVLARAIARGHHVAVVMADLDFFKAINDSHGHQVGDLVLQRFVRIARDALRASDGLGRVGGEEFLLVLPFVSGPETALLVAERIRLSLANDDWEAVCPGLNVTASFGVSYGERGESPQELIRRADLALYAAKSAGRNCSQLG